MGKTCGATVEFQVFYCDPIDKSLLAGKNELYATIPRLSLSRIVTHERRALALAHGLHAITGDASSYQVIDNRFRSPLRKLLVVCRRPPAVGMPFQSNGHTRILREQLHGLFEPGYRIGGELGAIGREVHPFKTKNDVTTHVVDLFSSGRIRALITVVRDAIAIGISRASTGIDSNTSRRIRTAIEAVDNAIAVTIQRTPVRIYAGAAWCIRTLVAIVCDTIAVTVEGTACCIDCGTSRRSRALVIAVDDAVSIGVGRLSAYQIADNRTCDGAHPASLGLIGDHPYCKTPDKGADDRTYGFAVIDCCAACEEHWQKNNAQRPHFSSHHPFLVALANIALD